MTHHVAEDIFLGTVLNSQQLVDLEYTGRAGITEEVVKEVVCRQLRRDGYSAKKNAPRGKGADIEGWSSQQGEIAVEAKGEASRPEMFHNYFLAALGQVVLRFGPSSKRYVVALPIHEAYVKLVRKVSREARKALNLEFWLVGGTPIQFTIHVVHPDTP